MNTDKILKECTTIIVGGEKVCIDNLDVYLIGSFKKYADFYKHIETGNVISVEEYYFRFKRDKETFEKYSFGETQHDYICIKDGIEEVMINEKY